MDRSIIVSVLIQMLCIRWTSTAEPIYECIGEKPLPGNPQEVSISVPARGKENSYKCMVNIIEKIYNSDGLLGITISISEINFVTATCTYKSKNPDRSLMTWTINGEPVPMEKVRRRTWRQPDGMYHTSLSMNVPSDDDDEEDFSCI